MKDILRYLTTWKFWKELIIMTLGMAIAVTFFCLQKYINSLNIVILIFICSYSMFYNKIYLNFVLLTSYLKFFTYLCTIKFNLFINH